MAKLGRIYFIEFCVYLMISCLTATELLGNEIRSNKGGDCQSVCSTTFQGPDEQFCFRGCRLMSVIDFIQGPITSLDEVGKACFQACNEAYGAVNASACAFGCQSELPNIEIKRIQLANLQMGIDEEGMMNMMDRFAEYSQRMMNCFMNQMTHQMRYGWVIISSSSSFDDGGRVVVVRGTPVRIAIHSDSIDEGKTSDYYESNLAAVDSGATPDVKQSQMMSLDFVAPYQGKDDIAKSMNTRTHEKYDWLSCLSAKSGLSKMSILFVLLTFLIILIWFVVGVVFPTRSSDKSAEYPKLSIYGDLEYLVPLDKKSLAFPSAEKFVTYTSPHLAKMQQI